MAHNIAKNAVERTSKALLDKVFPRFGKVAAEAAGAIFSAVVRTGSALVTDIADTLDGGVEVLFQDVKQCFRIERARVRTFRRLENLPALCTLAYSYFAHVLPDCGEETRRLLKTMKDSLGEIVESFRPFVANVRELLRLERTRFISGRPRKRKPPGQTDFLPGFQA